MLRELTIKEMEMVSGGNQDPGTGEIQPAGLGVPGDMNGNNIYDPDETGLFESIGGYAGAIIGGGLGGMAGGALCTAGGPVAIGGCAGAIGAGLGLAGYDIGTAVGSAIDEGGDPNAPVTYLNPYTNRPYTE